MGYCKKITLPQNAFRIQAAAQGISGRASRSGWVAGLALDLFGFGESVSLDSVACILKGLRVEMALQGFHQRCYKRPLLGTPLHLD